MKALPLITARLVGSDTAIAIDIVATGSAPIFELCRKLTVAGHAASTQLDAYRGTTLALSVRSIGEASKLRVRGSGYGFEVAEARPTAPPIRGNGSGARKYPSEKRRVLRPGPGGRQ
jgi:hypothetical protein